MFSVASSSFYSSATSGLNAFFADPMVSMVVNFALVLLIGGLALLVILSFFRHK